MGDWAREREEEEKEHGCATVVHAPMHGREWGKRKERRDRVEKEILTD
jgi:hypothetical protein